MASTVIVEADHRRRTVPASWPAAAGAFVGGAAGLIGVGIDAAAVVGPVVGALGVAVARSDLRQRRIPDRLLVVGAMCAAAAAAVVELLDGRRPAMSMLMGAAVAALPLLVAHLVSPAGIGFGDVKYAAVTGALLGVIALSLGALAVAIACAVAIVGVGTRRWPRSSIPYGTCLAGSAVVCMVMARWWPT